MKTATKSKNYEINEETLEKIISLTTQSVIATLKAEGYISRGKKAEPKAKKTSVKVTKEGNKVTKETSKKTSEPERQVRYCHHDKNGHLVVTKKPTSKKVTKKAKGWQYIKNADGSVTVKKS